MKHTEAQYEERIARLRAALLNLRRVGAIVAAHGEMGPVPRPVLNDLARAQAKATEALDTEAAHLTAEGLEVARALVEQGPPL